MFNALLPQYTCYLSLYIFNLKRASKFRNVGLNLFAHVDINYQISNDPEIEVRAKPMSYWGQALQSWHVGIFWGLYWFAKTGELRSDHGGQAHKWSWNRGQDKTSVLLRPGTSKLACGDLLGSILICQNWRTQKWPWRPGSQMILK